MPEKRNGREKDFSVYDTMETAQLEEILRRDAKSTEGKEPDTDMLLHIMEVLAERKKKEGAIRTTPEEALKIFQQYYLPCDFTEEAPLYKVQKRRRVNIRYFPRRLLVAITALALVVGGVITARAFGYDVWEVFVRWTQETFHFDNSTNDPDGSQPETSSNLECEELIQALTEYGVSENIVPTWLPDGYVFVDVDITETPKQKDFFAIFSKDNKLLKISIKSYIGSNPEQIEQSGVLIDTISIQGINYYIFADNDSIQTAWVNTSYECYISGPITVEEMKQIINSIRMG